MKYPKEKFEWTDEFVYRVLARGIFPGRYDIEDTKDAVRSAINGDCPSAIVSDAKHCGEKAIFPMNGRLVSFPFVRELGKIVVKSAFFSEKGDIEAYRRNKSVKNKI